MDTSKIKIATLVFNFALALGIATTPVPAAAASFFLTPSSGIPDAPRVGFGSVAVGGTSSPLTVTLHNGDATLGIASITADGDFSQTNSCGSSVAASTSCQINVRFSPTVTGMRSGTVVIISNAAGSPHTVSLSGIGDAMLDVSFGGGGKVVSPMTLGGSSALALALQADGKLIAAGTKSGLWNNEFALQRFNPDGTLDASFGTDGKVALSPSAGGGSYAQAIVQQADGKLVVAGTSHIGADTYESVLVRFNANGALDATFGAGGKVVVPISPGSMTTANSPNDSMGRSHALVLQADGKLVAAGYSTVGNEYAFTLARYLPNGTLDASFGTNGKVDTLIGPSYYKERLALVVQPDGKLVAAGIKGGLYYSVPLLVRYNPDGTLDQSFGVAGRTIDVAGERGIFVYALALQADGKLVTAGTGTSYGSGFALTRYNADGTRDSGFGIGGTVVTPIDVTSDIPNALVVQPDGKLVAAGTSIGAGGNWWRNGSMVRYNADGSLDASFGSGGKVLTTVGVSAAGNQDSHFYALVLQPDGRLVAAGSSPWANDWGFALVRYAPSGAAPTVPGSFTATAASSSQINLSWTASTDNVGVTGYKVYRGGALVASPTGTSYSDTGLTALTLYSYTVAACDAAGNCSAQSSAAATNTAAAPKIAAGDNHTCGLTNSGAAYCWGFNNQGQLGDGTFSQSTSPVAVSGGITFATLTAGAIHTCGLTGNGVAYCWGDNTYGQLGDGSTALLSLSPVAVSGGLTFASLTAGGYYTCGLTSGGVSYCWGANFGGELGDGTPTQRRSPVAVSGGLTYVSLTAGLLKHTCGVTSGGAAYCWGWNGYGQIGVSTGGDHTAPVAVSGGLSFASLTAGGQHTCGLTSGGAAYCWGDYSYGQLGNGVDWTVQTSPVTTPTAVLGGITFASLTAGNGHTCGLTAGGVAHCWGYNSDGRLGDGSTTWRTTPVAVSGALALGGLSAGGAHTCGLTSSGAVFCWGFNNQGQLGDGSTANRSAPVQVVGAGGTGFLNLLSAAAPDTQAPSIPSGLTATALSVSQVNLAWNAGTDNVGVTQYKVYRGGSLLTTLSGTPPAASFSDTGLTALTAYSYTVQACDAANNCSAQSGAVSATTSAAADTQAPTVPAGLAATAASATQVNLTWTASTDNVGVTGYKVYRNGTLVGSPTATSYSDTGLTASTQYSYTVAACDAAANCSAQSAAVSATTTSAGGVTTLDFALNWNLVGNSVNAPLTVANTFGDATKVQTVWKWVPAGNTPGIIYPAWAFYTPTLTDGGAAYAATKGYDFLTTINAGEGFWVNAKVAFTASLPTGTALTASSFQDQLDPAQNKLLTGWNLIATGDSVTPNVFNEKLSLTPPTTGPIPSNVTTLWAWDNTQSKWYFYAPSLEANGGLANYLISKGYLDFATLPGTPAGTLSPTTGFWVNKP